MFLLDKYRRACGAGRSVPSRRSLLAPSIALRRGAAPPTSWVPRRFAGLLPHPPQVPAKPSSSLCEARSARASSPRFQRAIETRVPGCARGLGYRPHFVGPPRIRRGCAPPCGVPLPTLRGASPPPGGGAPDIPPWRGGEGLTPPPRSRGCPPFISTRTICFQKKEMCIKSI